jgi:hypothetical protein
LALGYRKSLDSISSGSGINESMEALDRAMKAIQGPIFQNEDLAIVLKAFRDTGPGHAIFNGR